MDSLAREPTEPTDELLKTPEAIILMKTPCNHKFHVKCLQEWMKIKLECPFCRQSIPSL